MIPRRLLLLLATALPLCTMAQDPWTLTQCVEHALVHNNEAKQQALNVQSKERQLTAQRMGLLPSLNAGASHNLTFGRAIDYGSNSVSNDLQSTNLSVGASMDLFRGLQRLRSTQQSQLELQAARADADRIGNSIALNITAAYLQILYSAELVETQRRALNLSELQAERTRQLVQAGSLPEGNLLEIEAQRASDELNLVNAENQLDLARLTLAQMLNLSTTEGFDIARPNIDSLASGLAIPSAAEVFDQALLSMPQVRSAELRVQSTEKGIGIARSSRYPSLSLDASVSTGAISYLDPATHTNLPYPDQLRNNLSSGIGLSLRIPIFNGLQTETNIANAKIAHSSAQLALHDTKLQLFKTIQQAHTDALAAQKKLRASEQQLQALQQSLRYTESKFNVGLLNALDYTTARNKLAEAEQGLLQAKYDLLFKSKILQFYQGIPLSI